MFYEWKDIKGRKKEEKDTISIFIIYCFSQMNLLSYILCYFMLAYRVKAIIILLFDEKNSNRMIKQLLNLVIAKYRDFSLSRRSVICSYLYLICSPLTNHDFCSTLLNNC